MSRLNEILKPLRPDKTNRLRVILLCIFAATTFWFLNALNENYSTTLKYPLRFIYDSENYIAVEELPDHVQVNVSGLGWNLFRSSLGIKVTPLKIVLEEPAAVKKITGGTIPSLISDQMNDVQLNYVLTDTLYINIDHRITRKFAVRVDSAGISLDNNHRIVGLVRYTPDSVTLEGPQQILANMPDTLLIRIPQQDIDTDFNEDVAVTTPSNDLIRRMPPTVNVTFTVEEFVPREEVIPLKTENFPEDGSAYIQVNDAQVEFMIAQSKVEDLRLEDFSAVVDFKKMNKTDSTVAPELTKYPAFIQDIRLDTTKVKVYFNEE